MIPKKYQRRTAYPINFKNCSSIYKPKTNHHTLVICLKASSGLTLKPSSSMMFNSSVENSSKLSRKPIKTLLGLNNFFKEACNRMWIVASTSLSDRNYTWTLLCPSATNILIRLTDQSKKAWATTSNLRNCKTNSNVRVAEKESLLKKEWCLLQCHPFLLYSLTDLNSICKLFREKKSTPFSTILKY